MTVCDRRKFAGVIKVRDLRWEPYDYVGLVESQGSLESEDLTWLWLEEAATMHGWPERCNISGFEGGEGEPRTKACSSTENGVWPQPTGSRKTGTWIPHPQGTEFCQQIKCTGKRFSLEPPYRNSGANTLF